MHQAIRYEGEEELERSSSALFWSGLAAGLTMGFSADAKAAFTTIAREVIAPDAWTLLGRAVVAGWLIALMVWLLPAAEHARLPVIVIVTYLIALSHMAHSIAGSVDVFYLVVSGGAGWGDCARFASLALLGNVIGGVTLVAVLNHKQVVAGEDSGEGGSGEDRAREGAPTARHRDRRGMRGAIAAVILSAAKDLACRTRGLRRRDGSSRTPGHQYRTQDPSLRSG